MNTIRIYVACLASYNCNGATHLRHQRGASLVDEKPNNQGLKYGEHQWRSFVFEAPRC